MTDLNRMLPQQPSTFPAAVLLTRVVQLSTALGYPPRIIARIIYAGRFASLVECLARDARLRSSERLARHAQLLRSRMESFVLPDRYVREPELLFRRVEHIAGRI